MIVIKEITDKDKKAEITDKILRSLPDWFGIESAIVDYVRDVQQMPFWAAFDSDKEIGLIAIKEHYKKSAEIYVMGILNEYHRKGIGKKLIQTSEQYLVKNDYKFLQVKTLSSAHPDKHYAKTREFYLSYGFEAMEEFKTIWGESNPALQMIKLLEG